jgi:hypothetical protein
MEILGYARWNEFKASIERAILSMSVQYGENSIAAHFSGSLLKTGGRPKEDYRLSRLACYLVAMNGDPRKPEIAAAQSYFALKSRQAETIIPAQNDRIRELELENAFLDRQIRLRELDNTMLQLHGAPVVLALRGQQEQVVEVEKIVLEVIDKRCGDRRKGMTATQLNEYLKAKTGFKFKTGAELQRHLEKNAPDLLDLVQRQVNQAFVNEENIDRAIDILSRGSRQMLLGEG